jgi:hypothetical protein
VRSVVLRFARHIHGKRVRSARVLVPGRRARVVHGRRLRVSFKDVKARRIKVRVVYRLAGGKTFRTTRVYRTCP